MFTFSMGNQIKKRCCQVLFTKLKLRDLQLCNCAAVAQLVEQLAVTPEVVCSTPAGPTLRVFK